MKDKESKHGEQSPRSKVYQWRVLKATQQRSTFYDYVTKISLKSGFS